jgi:hypothetical protein
LKWFGGALGAVPHPLAQGAGFLATSLGDFVEEKDKADAEQEVEEEFERSAQAKRKALAEVPVRRPAKKARRKRARQTRADLAELPFAGDMEY